MNLHEIIEAKLIEIGADGLVNGDKCHCRVSCYADDRLFCWCCSFGKHDAYIQKNDFTACKPYWEKTKEDCKKCGKECIDFDDPDNSWVQYACCDIPPKEKEAAPSQDYTFETGV